MIVTMVNDVKIVVVVVVVINVGCLLGIRIISRERSRSTSQTHRLRLG